MPTAWGVAKKTLYAGVWWRRAAEADRAHKLELQRRAGVIKAWAKAPRFDLVINGKKCGWYTPDFLVTRLDGTQYLIEVKGWAAREFTFRLNVFRALYPTWEVQVVDDKGNPWKRRTTRRVAREDRLPGLVGRR